mmetsp:Transcript_11567/g.22456  ORF Transcript_11567/g.22456 Transcript_11567/m.22456 type:complete len:95 (-) Transcript_11567:919-1203(-)
MPTSPFSRTHGVNFATIHIVKIQGAFSNMSVTKTSRRFVRVECRAPMCTRNAVVAMSGSQSVAGKALELSWALCTIRHPSVSSRVQQIRFGSSL